MSGQRCKEIINQKLYARAKGLRKVLGMKKTREILTESGVEAEFAKLSEIELAAINGGTVPHGGLKGRETYLIEKKVLDPHVLDA